MRKEPSRARSSAAWAGSNLQRAAQYFWMSWASSLQKLKWRCYVCCRSGNLNVLAAINRFLRMCEGLRRQIATWKRALVLARFDEICSIVLTCSQLRFLLFANEKKPFPCWLNTSSIAMQERREKGYGL